MHGRTERFAAFAEGDTPPARAPVTAEEYSSGGGGDAQIPVWGHGRLGLAADLDRRASTWRATITAEIWMLRLWSSGSPTFSALLPASCAGRSYARRGIRLTSGEDDGSSSTSLNIHPQAPAAAPQSAPAIRASSGKCTTFSSPTRRVGRLRSIGLYRPPGWPDWNWMSMRSIPALPTRQQPSCVTSDMNDGALRPGYAHLHRALQRRRPHHPRAAAGDLQPGIAGSSTRPTERCLRSRKLT